MSLPMLTMTMSPLRFTEICTMRNLATKRPEDSQNKKGRFWVGSA